MERFDDLGKSFVERVSRSLQGGYFDIEATFAFGDDLVCFHSDLRQNCGFGI